MTTAHKLGAFIVIRGVAAGLGMPVPGAAGLAQSGNSAQVAP